ncbi:MAG: [Fe-Fe] hydrogenase large subunit C-terminal domain-containing protein [Pseudomonadota bacterium]
MKSSRRRIVPPTDPSITIDGEKCIACVACSKACPTQAIRVRENLARVNQELCIACGGCYRACPHEAVLPRTSSRADLGKFKYKVALPSLTLYAQFGRDVHPAHVLEGLKLLGFDATYDISWMCEMIAGATDAYLSECSGPWPKISVTCPAILRLIQCRYRDLLQNLVPIETARELSAKLLRRKLTAEQNLKPEEIGLFFITPCTAIMNSIVAATGLEQSYLDGALSISEIFAPLREAIGKVKQNPVVADLSPKGLLWAAGGGEIAGMRNANTLTASGLADTRYIFDRIESGKFQQVDFIEMYICPGGCVNGPLVMEQRYAAQRTIQRMAKELGTRAPVKEEKVRLLLREHFFDFESEIKARPIHTLGGDLREKIARKKKREEILSKLPRKDCAACGAPDCATHAHDVVAGEAKVEDCVFVLLDQLKKEKS